MDQKRDVGVLRSVRDEVRVLWWWICKREREGVEVCKRGEREKERGWGRWSGEMEKGAVGEERRRGVEEEPLREETGRWEGTVGDGKEEGGGEEGEGRKGRRGKNRNGACAYA